LNPRIIRISGEEFEKLTKKIDWVQEEGTSGEAEDLLEDLVKLVKGAEEQLTLDEKLKLYEEQLVKEARDFGEDIYIELRTLSVEKGIYVDLIDKYRATWDRVNNMWIINKKDSTIKYHGKTLFDAVKNLRDDYKTEEISIESVDIPYLDILKP
jgi:hypothetical protein